MIMNRRYKLDLITIPQYLKRISATRLSDLANELSKQITKYNTVNRSNIPQ